MSVNALHTLYAVDVDPITESNAVFIDQVSNFSIDPAIQEVLAAADGQVDPTFVAAIGQSPRITFTSSALATLLAEMSNAFLTSGIKINSDVTHDGLDCFFQQLAEGSTRASGAAHFKMTINEGLLVPRQISVAQGGLATMGLEGIVTYDGTNDPIVLADSQSLIGSPSVDELFTLGPISINGSQLTAVQSLTIDPGIVEVVAIGDGDKWATYAAIMSRAPMITIQTLDVTALSTFGITGTAQTATDTILYLRKLAEGGTHVADATAQHIKITIDEGMIRCGPALASHGATAGIQVNIRPTYDGTNGILVVDPASAIT